MYVFTPPPLTPCLFFLFLEKPIASVLLKANDEKDRMLNFAIFVFWSASYALAKHLGERKASHDPAFMGNWQIFIHTF